MASPQIPSLRANIVRITRGGQRLLEDPIQHIRMPVDGLTERIIEALTDGPLDPDRLVARVGASRFEVRRRVELLNRHAFLATPRGARQQEVHGRATALWDQGAIAQAPLTLPAGLAHGCVACGSCCTNNDVGPLREEERVQISSVDWSEHLPGDVAKEDWFSDVSLPDGRSFTLMGQRHGQCVFLDKDRRCVIHSVAGAEAKPTVCRQFPYTFTRTPEGVNVSFSMECWSWSKARQQGRPASEETTAVRALLAQGASVLDMPVPIVVCDGLNWSYDDWIGLQASVLEAVHKAESLSDLSQAVVTPVHAAVELLLDALRIEEDFLTRATWRIPPDQDHGHGVLSLFKVCCARLSTAFADELATLAGRYEARDQFDRAEHHRRLARALEVVLSGEEVSDISRDPEELSLWRDMVKAALYSHEPIRRGGLVAGFAELSFRLIIGQTLAALFARDAQRTCTNTRDVVDSMVLVTKMLRGTLVTSILRRTQKELIHVAFINASVFSHGSAPRGAILDPLIPCADT